LHILEKQVIERYSPPKNGVANYVDRSLHRERLNIKREKRLQFVSIAYPKILRVSKFRSTLFNSLNRSSILEMSNKITILKIVILMK